MLTYKLYNNKAMPTKTVHSNFYNIQKLPNVIKCNKKYLNEEC